MVVCVVFIAFGYNENYYRNHRIFYDYFNVNENTYLPAIVDEYILEYNSSCKDSVIIDWYVKEITKKLY